MRAFSESLNEQMPNQYVASINRLVWIDEKRWRIPDVSVFGEPNYDGSAESNHNGFELDTGMVAVLDEEVEDTTPWEQQYLEIIDVDGDRLVTAIELLSPSNKNSNDPGRLAFQNKQARFRKAGVNLVEIDLLRSGSHTTAIDLYSLRKAVGPFDYHASVYQAAEKRFLVKGIRLADPLPKIVVPLDPGIPSMTVDLQPIFERAYKTGRYGRLLNYQRLCEPVLTATQQLWAEERIQQSLNTKSATQ